MKFDKATLCPTCGSFNDGVTSVTRGDRVLPKPKDISICLYCGTVAEFGADMSLSALSDDALAALPLDERERKTVMRARELWQKMLRPKFEGKGSSVRGSA